MLTEEQVREFAERGYVVVPQVVSGELVDRASRAVDAMIDRDPPGPEVRGNHFYFNWPGETREPALFDVLTAGPILVCAEALTGPGTLLEPWQVQVALNIPPYDHRPGRPHIDGGRPGLPRDEPPGTFTMLLGVLMSDQLEPDGGNLWVWPGTHLAHAEYFTEHGPDAFYDSPGYPPIDLPEPEQIRGRAGDLLIAHYLLGHNIGGNTSDRVRRALYFRVKHKDHDPRWREILQDPWLEYDQVRTLTAAPRPGRTSA